MYTYIYIYIYICGPMYIYIYIYILVSFCESRALSAKVDQGRGRSASNVDAATYTPPVCAVVRYHLSQVCRGACFELCKAGTC